MNPEVIRLLPVMIAFVWTAFAMAENISRRGACLRGGDAPVVCISSAFSTIGAQNGIPRLPNSEASRQPRREETAVRRSPYYCKWRGLRNGAAGLRQLRREAWDSLYRHASASR